MRKFGGTEGRRRGSKRDEEWRQGEENEARDGEEAKDRERRDSQSMKQFDNLVILLLTSIPSQRSAIKLDTERQRNKEAGTLWGRPQARKTHTNKQKKDTQHTKIHTEQERRALFGVCLWPCVNQCGNFDLQWMHWFFLLINRLNTNHKKCLKPGDRSVRRRETFPFVHSCLVQGHLDTSTHRAGEWTHTVVSGQQAPPPEPQPQQDFIDQQSQIPTVSRLNQHQWRKPANPEIQQAGTRFFFFFYHFNLIETTN